MEDMVNTEASRTPGDAVQKNGHRTLHRIFQVTVIVAVLIFSAMLLIYGRDYYFIDSIDKPYSPEHPVLKSSGSIGLRLGITGMIFFVVIFLYPLRKHWALLGRIGMTKNWFDYHVIFGLTAPAIVTFHSAFKLYGFAGMAYWTMLALLVSGLVGRYFYAQIPRNIDAAEMTLKEMQALKSSMLEELKHQKIFEFSEVERLFYLPDDGAVRSMNILQALIQMVSLDLVRLYRTWSLRNAGWNPFRGLGTWKTGDSELERVVVLASKQAKLSKRILFMSQAQRIFHLWHVVHRPFSLSFAVFILIHVTVVVWLGYY